MAPPAHFIIISLLPLLLNGCSGTVGTLAWRSWTDQGTKVTEIKSMGIEARNLPGYRGTTVGWRHTIYCCRSEGGNPSNPEDAPWNYFWAPGPDEIPLHLSELTLGQETVWTPAFAGTAVGITSRSITVLPVNANETLTISLNMANPKNARFKLQPASR